MRPLPPLKDATPVIGREDRRYYLRKHRASRDTDVFQWIIVRGAFDCPFMVRRIYHSAQNERSLAATRAEAAYSLSTFTVGGSVKVL